MKLSKESYRIIIEALEQYEDNLPCDFDDSLFIEKIEEAIQEIEAIGHEK